MLAERRVSWSKSLGIPTMPYDLEYHEKAVVPFLEDEERVSAAMRDTIERSLEEHLGQHGDSFCLNESYRIPGTSYFRFDIVLSDPESGKWRRFWFTVSDAAAQYGVLRVMLIEEAS
jgi:hypothetical protein